MNEHDELLELTALYALDALEADERRLVEAHLAAGCTECDAELASLRPVVDGLAAAVAPVEVSPELRERVMALAAPEPVRQSTEPQPSRSSVPRWPLFAAAASLLLAAMLGVQLLALRSELRTVRSESSDLARALATEQETLQWVRSELEEARSSARLLTAKVSTLEATTRVLTAPATRSVELAGQGPGEKARARAFLSPSTGTLILYAYDLPALAAGKTYQAWVIPAAGPVPAGIFARGADGAVRHEVGALAGLDAEITVAVTIEPAGGLPAPSGPIVLAGKS